MRFRLLDPQGASRSVSYLMLAGGPFNFITGIVLVDNDSPVSTIAFTLLCAALTGVGAVCRWWPHRIPQLFWLLVPFLSTALITGLNLATDDASTGAQLFYLWPVLYVANFLSTTVVITTLVLVSAGQGAVVTDVLGSAGLTDWVSLTVAFTLTAIVVGSLRSRNEQLRRVLEAQALSDPLTGVANRRSFDEGLTRAVGWATSTGQPISLLTLDIDHFKKINDVYGHAAGDQALQHVAKCLQAAAQREDDVVARLGGDEFVVLLRTDPVNALRAADDIRAAALAADHLPCGPPGLSIGIAALPDHAGSAAELIAASDAALYAAKERGRGRTAMADWPVPPSQPAETAVSRS